MIIHYGYADGSGKYFISIDSDKCDACGGCLASCPASVLELQDVEVDIEMRRQAVVKEIHRKKLKYSCGACVKNWPCMKACRAGAIDITWI